jgi:hypothetical protein
MCALTTTEVLHDVAIRNLRDLNPPSVVVRAWVSYDVAGLFQPSSTISLESSGMA